MCTTNTLGHTQKANKRQVWNSAITVYSRLSASKAKRTRPPLILADNCTPTTQGKSTKGGGKHTDRPAHRMGRYENRTGVVKKTCLLCVFYLVTCGDTHNLHSHMLDCYTTVKKGAVVEGRSWANSTNGKECHFFFCLLLQTSPEWKWHCWKLQRKMWRKHLRPGLNTKHMREKKIGTMLEILKDRARKDEWFISKRWVLWEVFGFKIIFPGSFSINFDYLGALCWFQ